MTGGTEILTFIFDKSCILVAMDCMTVKAGNFRPIVRIGRCHGRLMRAQMAAAAYCRLFLGICFLRLPNILGSRVIYVSFPPVMASDTT